MRKAKRSKRYLSQIKIRYSRHLSGASTGSSYAAMGKDDTRDATAILAQMADKSSSNFAVPPINLALRQPEKRRPLTPGYTTARGEDSALENSLHRLHQKAPRPARDS